VQVSGREVAVPGFLRSSIVLIAFALPACRERPPSSEPDRGPAQVFGAFVDAWNHHDAAALDTLVSAEAVHEDLALGFRGEGPEAFKGFMHETFRQIPDFDWRPGPVLVDGTGAAAEWTLAGTYSGDTPTGAVRGRPFSVRGVSFVLTQGGRITRFSDYYNLAEFYRQVSEAATK
jgi:steroid delta-isomerase-like uncharacterized protein